MNRANSRYRRPRKDRALSLIEVMLALFVFLMMMLLVGAVLPAATRTTHYSNTYGYAVALCQRKIDQLQEAGWDKLNVTDLRTLGVIDDRGETVSGGVHVYSFTYNDTGVNTTNNADNLGTFFPGNYDPATRATGTIRIEPWESGNVTISGNLQSVMKKVTVTISWRDPNAPANSFSMTSLISKTDAN